MILTQRRIDLYLMINSENTITKLFKRSGYSLALVNRYIREFYDHSLISKTRTGRQVFLEYTKKGILVYKGIKDLNEGLKHEKRSV